MRKKTAKKMTLNKETLRKLEESTLTQAAGGATERFSQCYPTQCPTGCLYETCGFTCGCPTPPGGACW